MNPKVKTVLLGVVSIAILAANQLAPANAPVYVHAGGALILGVLLIVNLLHAPPSVVETISTLLTAVTKGDTLATDHPAVLAARRTLRRAYSIVPLSALILALGSTPTLATATLVSTEACNATPAQIGTTILDGLKLAGCLIPQILSGITDPAQLLVCEGATEDLIIAAIDDFTAQKPQMDGGLASLADLNGITAVQRGYLAEARQKAVARKAARVGGK